MAGRTFGIDFGTTNSLVSYVEDDGAKTIDLTDLKSQRPHPSVVWYRGGGIVVGETARANLDSGAEAVSGDFVRSPKRLLARVRLEQAMRDVNSNVKLPRGYKLDWAGEYESQKRANKRLSVIVPITVLMIALLLYSAFGSFKWAGLVMVNILLAPVGGLYALYITGTHFSVSSGVGFLALFGVAVQTGVIMVEYINQLRAAGKPVEEAAVEGAVLRLRPIMMTMLVATLGLLPAALSHGIGSDSQRPFAIVIVGGLSATLLLSIFVLPAIYVWIARPGDLLPVEHDLEEAPQEDLLQAT